MRRLLRRINIYENGWLRLRKRTGSVTYARFIVMSEKVGCLHGIRKTYYILHIWYTNSQINISLSYIRPTSFDDSNLITKNLVRDLSTSILVFAAVRLLTFYKSIILAPLCFYVFRVKQISDPVIFIFTIHAIFHFHSLDDSSCMVKAVQQHKDYQQQFQTKKCVSIKN